MGSSVQAYHDRLDREARELNARTKYEITLTPKEREELREFLSNAYVL